MELLINQNAVSVRDMLAKFSADRRPDQMGETLAFDGVNHLDVYNPSIPFSIDGKTVLAGRVENRADEVSRTLFFEQHGSGWRLIRSAPEFSLQDPFVTQIDGEIWLGGVSVIWDGSHCVSYHTRFYHGHSLNSMSYAFSGPAMMKDIRLLQLADGKIAVFSRPQGELMLQKYGCVAKIGYVLVDSIDQVNAELIENAPLLDGQFTPDEWGGCNQLYVISNGLIGVIGHIACGEMIGTDHIIHYYGMSFAIDPLSRACTPIKIIAARDCFPPGPQKNVRTADVIFTAGMTRLEDGQALLYAGLSDCQAGVVKIADPLIEYEKIDLP
jgi:hypothetical protein